MSQDADEVQERVRRARIIDDPLIYVVPRDGNVGVYVNPAHIVVIRKLPS